MFAGRLATLNTEPDSAEGLFRAVPAVENIDKSGQTPLFLLEKLLL